MQTGRPRKDPRESVQITTIDPLALINTKAAKANIQQSITTDRILSSALSTLTEHHYDILLFFAQTPFEEHPKAQKHRSHPRPHCTTAQPLSAANTSAITQPRPSTMDSRLEELVLKNVKDGYQTERIMREIISGGNLKEISSALDIPMWQLSLRIANFGLHCFQLAVLRGEDPYGPACEHHCPDHVEAFNEEQSKVVVIEAMAHMMAGTPPVPALLMAECLQARMIAKEDEDQAEMGGSEDDSWWGCFSESEGEAFDGKGKGEKNGPKAGKTAPDGGKVAIGAGKTTAKGQASVANGAKVAEKAGKTTVQSEKAVQSDKTAVGEQKSLAKGDKPLAKPEKTTADGKATTIKRVGA